MHCDKPMDKLRPSCNYLKPRSILKLIDSQQYRHSKTAARDKKYNSWQKIFFIRSNFKKNYPNLSLRDRLQSKKLKFDIYFALSSWSPQRG